MNKERVLIVHNYYQVPGGEDTVVANEKKMFEDKGHEVILYSRNNSELKKYSIIRKLCLPFTSMFSFRTYREVKVIIREKKIDIVHVHNTLGLISPSVYYAAFRCKVPVVQTIHNFRLLCPGATFYRDGYICEDCVSKGLRYAIKHKCYRESFIQTLAIVITLMIHRLLGVYKKLNYICLTQFNKEKLLSLKQVKPEKVFVKPNFVDIKQEIIPFADRKNQFIFAGRIDKLKGLDILLEAWKLLGAEASELVICGTGPMEEWCQDFIRKNELTNIRMLGFVPNEHVKKIIAESKSLILPTQWSEGFPMTIVEAFSAGTPVIGSDIGNVGSLITDGMSGMKFKHDSPEALAKAVKEAVGWDMVEFTFDNYCEKYTTEANYKKMVLIYAEIKLRK